MTSCPPLPRQDMELVLRCTRDLWEEARGASFFITGGTGFFGVWLLESFAHINDALGLGAKAVVLTRSPGGFSARVPHLVRRGDVRLVEGDVRSFVFPSGAFQYVIHAAAEAGTNLNVESPAAMFDCLVGGTQRVLEFAAAAGTKKLLLVSSGAVYGRQPAGLPAIGEDFTGGPDPLLAGSAYAEGKRAAEHMAAVAAGRGGYSASIARCFAFVGPHLPTDGHFAIGNFIRDAMSGRVVGVSGDGTPERSYLYAADLAAWLWTILFRGASGRAYNVGSASPIRISDLARMVASTVGDRCEAVVAQASRPGAPRQAYIPSVDRARNELGLEVWTPLPEAISRTAAWLAMANGQCPAV